MKKSLLIYFLFGFFIQNIQAQVSLSPQVQNATLNFGGGIVLNISGGIQPYSILWGDGNVSDTRTNLNTRAYTVTVTDANNNTISNSFEVKSEMNWKNIKGVTIQNNLITKSNTGWNAGAFSTNKLKQGEDGYFEHTLTSLQDHYMIGFAETDLGVNTNTIPYQIFVKNNNQVGVRSFGSWKKTLTNTASVGDKIKVEKQGSTIKFYYNGQLKHTFSNVPDKDYFIDFNPHTVNNLNLDLLTNFGYEIVTNDIITHLNYNNALSGGIDLTNTKGGIPPYTYIWNDGSTQNQLGVTNSGIYDVIVTDANNEIITKSIAVNYDVIWQNEVNITTNQNMLNSTGTGYWQRGMSSLNVLPPSSDGYFEFKPTSLTQRYSIGFSSNDKNQNHNTIEYAILIWDKGLNVYQSGEKVAGLGSFVLGDKLTMRKVENIISIEKNGIRLYTAECDSKASYIIDGSIRDVGQLELDITASFGFPTLPTSAHYTMLNSSKKQKINTLGNTLKITIPNSITDISNLQYKIFKWNKTEEVSGTLSTSNMTNKGIEIPVNSLNLNLGETYLLEIEENNNEKYYLKFKYTN